MSRGILLLNLGSPEAPTIPAVRRYLHEFLMDRHVIDVPYLLRKFIVCCTILPRRPRTTAAAYQSIWWNEGSPLVVISERVRDSLQAELSEPVELGMRYGEPSIGRALEQLRHRSGELDEIFLVPLYPHYAASSYGTAIEATERALARMRWQVDLQVMPPFYDDPLYIDALVDSARASLDAGFDHLLFSYHGLPERHIRNEDPTGSHCLTVENCCHVDSPVLGRCYRAQVHRTTAAFVAKTGLSPDQYSLSFQSRLGRDPWLRPYTDHVIEELARKGVEKLLVICPAFTADCLETLEEIGMRAKESFIAAGGRECVQVPCINDNPLFTAALRAWCTQPNENARPGSPSE